MASDDSSKEVPKKIVAHAISIAFGTLCSRVLGLVRDIVMAALFRREITDAWSAAFRLPNLFRRLLGEGALSVSFIPVFIHAKLDSPERARNLANGFYTLLLVFLALFTAAGILGAESVMDFLLDANFDAEKRALTLSMARIMFGFIFLITTFAYFMGILNALGNFAWAALAPTLFNVVMIGFALMPERYFSFPGESLAWGVLVGGFVQVSLLIPLLQRRGMLPKWTWRWSSEDVRQVLSHLVPGLLGMGLLQFLALINLRYASGLGDGAVSYMYWADRLLELPLSLVSVSLGSALLPTLAQLWSQNLSEKMSDTANYYLRLNLFIAVPAAFGLYFLAEPIVRVLFERGEFTAEDAIGTASVLRIYAFLLVGASAIRVLVPSYFAAKKVWYPAVVTFACICVHLILAPRMTEDGGLQGLILATAVTVFLAAGLLLSGYQQRMGTFDFVLLGQQVLKFILASVGMTGALLIYKPLIQIFGDSKTVEAVVLIFTIATGMVTYVVTSYLLQTEELETFRRRFGR